MEGEVMLEVLAPAVSFSLLPEAAAKLPLLPLHGS